MRARGRLGVTVLLLTAAIAGAVGLERAAPRVRADVPAGSASSGAWFCPHGGGKDWQTSLFLANPGDRPVEVRVTAVSDHKPTDPVAYTVAPRSELRVEADSSSAASAAFVEYFGGWIAAGWVMHPGGGLAGVGAEPCAPAPSRRWFAVDGMTQQGQIATLVVMNPFDAVAVVDLAIYSEQRAPIRDSELTNVEVPPHRSISVRLNPYALDEAAASAEVIATTGRVAVASLGITADGGIRSVLGVTQPTERVFLPSVGGAGQSILVVMAPNDGETAFGATLLSEAGTPEPAGGITDATQSGLSSHLYPVITDGSTVIDLSTGAGSAPIVAVRRVSGRGVDTGATGGLAGEAAGWVVLPTVGGDPNTPGMVLANPGSSEITVTLHLLTEDGSTLPDETVRVPPTSAVQVPGRFLERDPYAAVLATSTQGAFLAAGASSSRGKLGVAGYALAVGVPIPNPG